MSLLVTLQLVFVSRIAATGLLMNLLLLLELRSLVHSQVWEPFPSYTVHITCSRVSQYTLTYECLLSYLYMYIYAVDAHVQTFVLVKKVSQILWFNKQYYSYYAVLLVVYFYDFIISHYIFIWSMVSRLLYGRLDSMFTGNVLWQGHKTPAMWLVACAQRGYIYSGVQVKHLKWVYVIALLARFCQLQTL